MRFATVDGKIRKDPQSDPMTRGIAITHLTFRLAIKIVAAAEIQPRHARHEAIEPVKPPECGINQRGCFRENSNGKEEHVKIINKRRKHPVTHETGDALFKQIIFELKN